MTKALKFSYFQNVFEFFPNFLTDFVDWNIEKGQRGTNALSVGFSEEFFAVCENNTKMTKNPKIYNFQSFHAFLLFSF